MVTGNPGKAAEVQAFFGGSLDVDHVALDIPEHRSPDIGVIAREKAAFAFQVLKTPLIVDDTGLFIDSLNGFPGPYAAFVQDTIGNAGILRLLDGIPDRRARFITCIGYADSRGVHVFSGILEGVIAYSGRGANGFGYDPIFELDNRTLAELSSVEKGRISHRARALASFRTWFTGQEPSSRRDTNG